MGERKIKVLSEGEVNFVSERKIKGFSEPKIKVLSERKIIFLVNMTLRFRVKRFE